MKEVNNIADTTGRATYQSSPTKISPAMEQLYFEMEDKEHVFQIGLEKEMNMPTSTFGKQFEVRHEKAADFVREMSKSVAPTLRQDFHSNMVFLHQNTRLKESLIRALNVR